ncbi:MAG: MFS transporter [Anaerolineales bacterium]|nr:MFS transporter [Anaerolineales bacterium]
MTNSTAPPQENIDTPESVNRLIGIGLLTRLLTDTGIQIFFPFLPNIASGLGISAIAMGRLVSLRSSTGLLSPLFGSLADRQGYRITMRLGLLMSAVGYGAIAFSTNLWMAAVGMFLAGTGTFAFAPTMQAYLSMKLPYHRRARGIGILEYAWALSGILGLYLVGLLIEATNWRVPLYIISGGLLITAVWYSRLPAADVRHSSDTKTAAVGKLPSWPQIRAFFELGENGRSAWAALISQGLIMFSAMHLFINYGSWLAADYQLTPARLGWVALILGIADLCASVLVSLFADRLGKRHSVLIGVIIATVGFAVLPLMNVGLETAVIGLILVRFSFEFSVVSNMAVLSEQVPAQRGKMMTLGAAFALLGSTLAGFTGPLAYARIGIWGLGIIPAVAMGITLILMISMVKE